MHSVNFCPQPPPLLKESGKEVRVSRSFGLSFAGLGTFRCSVEFVLSIMASNKTLDVSRDGTNLRLLIGTADVTVSRLSRAFQAPYCKGLIGLDL